EPVTRSSCSWLTSGPMRVSGSRPGPCFISAAVLASLSANSSCIFCSTKRRVPAQHTWPAQKKTPSSAPCTAASGSASLKTMLGDLPPSSSDTRLSVDAVSRWISFPTSVEPVKAILRSEEHTSELQSRFDLVCRLLLEKKNTYRRRQRQ